MRSEYPHRDTECHKCKKKGHLARVCRSSNTTTNSNLEKIQVPAEQIDTVMHLNKLSDIKAIRNSKKKILEVQINGQNVMMEFDSGAPTGIISKKTLHAIKLV